VRSSPRHRGVAEHFAQTEHLAQAAERLLLVTITEARQTTSVIVRPRRAAH
jgi:hypothetical protein